MLEKPNIADERITACLREAHRLNAVELSFLPLGADRNTAVYRAGAEDGKRYFVKLRRGAFDEMSVTLPRFLADQGIAQIIAPLPTKQGGLWTSLEAFRVIVYPFVEGRDGYEVGLSERQWAVFGAALKRIHTLALPATLRGSIRQEDYSAEGRDSVVAFLHELEHARFDEPVAARVAAFLRAKRADVLDLVARAQRLAGVLRTRQPDLVLCHSDLHAGNIHVAGEGELYLVDWDEPILAPKERDLMYAGGGLMGGWRTPEEEEALFYQGYGKAEIDAAALAYYRYERIVQDVKAYCEQLLLTDKGGQDREQSLGYLTSSFAPGGVLEVAYRSDRATGQLS